jgi:metal-responsive CopG/Arc/MetJ family transcriptional regulator
MVIGVVIPKTMREEFRSHSERTGAPLNALVRIALRRYLDEQKVQTQTEIV